MIKTIFDFLMQPFLWSSLIVGVIFFFAFIQMNAKEFFSTGISKLFGNTKDVGKFIDTKQGYYIFRLFSFIAVPIHELLHAIFGLISGFIPTKIHLLTLKKDKKDRSNSILGDTKLVAIPNLTVWNLVAGSIAYLAPQLIMYFVYWKIFFTKDSTYLDILKQVTAISDKVRLTRGFHYLVDGLIKAFQYLLLHPHLILGLTVFTLIMIFAVSLSWADIYAASEYSITLIVLLTLIFFILENWRVNLTELILVWILAYIFLASIIAIISYSLGLILNLFGSFHYQGMHQKR